MTKAQASGARVSVTLCAVRHLPSVGSSRWGARETFEIELSYKDKTHKTSVVEPPPTLAPVEKFEFDLSLGGDATGTSGAGEVEDICIELKHCNWITSPKLLGTHFTCFTGSKVQKLTQKTRVGTSAIGADTLKRLMAGDKSTLLTQELLVTAADGGALMDKDRQQARLLVSFCTFVPVKQVK
jgi:hypothetical protein